MLNLKGYFPSKNVSMNSEARFPNACSATSGNCKKLPGMGQTRLDAIGSSNFFGIVSANFWQFLLNTFFSVVFVEVLDVCQKFLASSCKRLELLDFVLLCDGMPEWSQLVWEMVFKLMELVSRVSESGDWTWVNNFLIWVAPL